jgi:hypothetical protein
MAQSVPRVTGIEKALLAALAAWGLFPLVLLLIHAGQAHARFTGADGLIGADGVVGADQLQYLAWARDAAAHGLASDLFSLAPSGHVYLEPIFAIIGGLHRIGLSLTLAYLLFKPVAIIALLLGAVAWARRTFADQLAARAAVVALSLFMYTPLAALFSWTQLGGGSFRFSLYLLAYEILAANKLWGYVPSALALALLPVALLAVERALDPDRSAPARTPGTAAPTSARRAPGRPVMVAALAALAASWLHPWQGVTLIVIFAGLFVLQRGRPWFALGVAALGAALPLGYYALLSRTDPAWKLASHYEVIPRLPALVLLAGLGPLALLAALGLRRPRGDVIEQALLLWIAGCLITYFANDAFAPHALQGLSLPLAVLTVRGGQRLRVPLPVGALAVGLLTIPGLAYDARKFVNTARNETLVQYYLPGPDARALSWVGHRAPPGGVLAPTPFALVIPSQTGRAVWVGHGYWSRDYVARARRVDALFRGRMAPARARAFVTSTRAGLLVADCRHRANLTRPLGSLIGAVHRFGCARVYVLRAAQRRSASR